MALSGVLVVGIPRVAQRLDLSPGVRVPSIQRANHIVVGRPIEVSVTVMSVDRYRVVHELQDD